MTGGRVYIVRHGETAWSAAGRHTGRTDVPLTEHGRWQARQLAQCLPTKGLSRVLSSPLSRARETALLAGYDPEVSQDLAEWDYGSIEGITTAEVQARRPGWALWSDGPPGGETLDELATRATRVREEIDRQLAAAAGESAPAVLLFAHSHLLRVLGALWLGVGPQAAAGLVLDPASVSTLGYEHSSRALLHWNLSCTTGWLAGQEGGPARTGTGAVTTASDRQPS